MIYVDTSVLAAYYCPEPLSEKAEGVIRAEPAPAVSDLTEVELISALSRKTREGELSKRDAARIAAQFATHLDEKLYTRLPIERRHYQMAKEWIGLFAMSLRTLDALHLAAAISAGARLVTSDRRLAGSAKKLGIDFRYLTG